MSSMGKVPRAVAPSPQPAAAAGLLPLPRAVSLLLAVRAAARRLRARGARALAAARRSWAISARAVVDVPRHWAPRKPVQERQLLMRTERRMWPRRKRKGDISHFLGS